MSSYLENTLSYDRGLCTGCGLCSVVCPHRVFGMDGRTARLERAEDCMECGACERNCASGAIRVRSGVGCASAIFVAALFGRDEATCGPSGGPGGGPSETACCSSSSVTTDEEGEV